MTIYRNGRYSNPLTRPGQLSHSKRVAHHHAGHSRAFDGPVRESLAHLLGPLTFGTLNILLGEASLPRLLARQQPIGAPGRLGINGPREELNFRHRCVVW